MPVNKSLVIVESPAKARTISSFLGDGYVVESSIGHVRDLPKRAADVPEEYKKAPWSKLGVDVENGFRPLYVVDQDKKQQIAKLKKLLKEADELLLATDEDREGESIAWHLTEVLKPSVPVKRMVFHEITQRAIQQAIQSPRGIDRSLVDAQEARRILDRLYGYEVSPVLWKKVMPRLSAGRVQSVATRIIVERERARMRFRPASYWDIEGHFATRAAEPAELAATLVGVDDRRLATGKDFGESGELGDPAVLRLDEPQVKALCDELGRADIRVESVGRKPYKRSPAAPFMTSTLQQEAGRKLKFSSARTMRAAQRLYENGYITYMRTDSTTLSGAALEAARRLIDDQYGGDYLPEAPRLYKNKVKNAQEAHEAIRPAGDSFKSPERVAKEVEPDEAKLYELIWKRTVASQMQDARGESVQVRIAAKTPSGKTLRFAVSGNVILFPGFFRAYVEGSDDPAAELENRERHLPPLKEGDVLDGRRFVPQGHETQPPARYTEASLVRKLEELGVGRPSTYASIISTIQDRGYVWRRGTALVPSFKAFAVVRLLEKHFAHLVDYTFTARMEDDLDAIARGAETSVPWLERFYFGGPANDQGDAHAKSGQGGDAHAKSGQGGDDGDAEVVGLQRLVSDQLGVIDAREINSVPIGKDSQGREIVVRVGKFGPYLQRGDETVSVPEDLPPDQLDVAKAEALLAAPSGDRLLGDDPDTGLPVYAKAGRFGAYVQLGDPDPGSKTKPKTVSLLSGMTLDGITLADACKLLTLPREVGPDPVDGQTIYVNHGRYGAYLTKGSDNRSLESEDQIFTVTPEEASALFQQPKRRGRRAAAEPLRELGADPVSGGTITLRKGRFGPYVTDGETNASLRTGDDPETLTPERAQELLQLRREKGGGKKPAKKKAASKASVKSNGKKSSGNAKARKTATSKAATSKAKTASKSASKSATAKAAGASKKKANGKATGTGRSAGRSSDGAEVDV